ncbi:hypothetical protein [Pseudomonas syringae]|uniref:hypothetical protein n=1 Tax=Pseudomonas syringae TaxID=317 RepID=UPI000816949B|nr:hypothetical protein [Pseudomonas syringae]
MKRPLLLTLTFSLLAANAFAMPAAEQPASGEAKMESQAVYKTVAQDTPRLIQQYQRVAEHGPERLVQQYQRV